MMTCEIKLIDRYYIFLQCIERYGQIGDAIDTLAVYMND